MQALNGGGTAQCCVGADDIDRALQQLTDRNRGVEYIVVTNRREAEVGFQPVQVAQQTQVGVCDALPVGNTQVQRTPSRLPTTGLRRAAPVLSTVTPALRMVSAASGAALAATAVALIVTLGGEGVFSNSAPMPAAMLRGTG